jgi:hypothetical protein
MSTATMDLKTATKLAEAKAERDRKEAEAVELVATAERARAAEQQKASRRRTLERQIAECENARAPVGGPKGGWAAPASTALPAMLSRAVAACGVRLEQLQAELARD